jgi:hypothetical protein
LRWEGKGEQLSEMQGTYPEEGDNVQRQNRSPSDPTDEVGVVQLRPRRRAGEPGNAQEREHRGTLEFTYHKISMYFGLPLTKAARALDISGTSLKLVCRRLGIHRWPYTRGGLERMGMGQGSGAQDSLDELLHDDINDTEAIPTSSQIDQSQQDEEQQHQQQDQQQQHHRLQNLELPRLFHANHRTLDPLNMYTAASHAELLQAGGLNNIWQHQRAQHIGQALSRQDMQDTSVTSSSFRGLDSELAHPHTHTHPHTHPHPHTHTHLGRLLRPTVELPRAANAQDRAANALALSSNADNAQNRWSHRGTAITAQSNYLELQCRVGDERTANALSLSSNADNTGPNTHSVQNRWGHQWTTQSNYLELQSCLLQSRVGDERTYHTNGASNTADFTDFGSACPARILDDAVDTFHNPLSHCDEREKERCKHTHTHTHTHTHSLTDQDDDLSWLLHGIFGTYVREGASPTDLEHVLKRASF